MKKETMEEFLERGGNIERFPYIKPVESQTTFISSNVYKGELASFLTIQQAMLYFYNEKKGTKNE